MKANAFNRYKYSGDLYKYVDVTVGETTTQEYYFVKRIPIKVSLEISGQLRIKCEEPIQIGSVISNITDIDNNQILDQQNWEITGLEPILNPFNFIEEYRLRAIKFAGTL